MIYNSFLPQALSIGVTYETFWELNPRTLQPFVDAFQMRMKRELEAERTKIDLLAWQIGVYTRYAVGGLFDRKAKYPAEPLTIASAREQSMTGADHAARFAAWAAQHNAGRIKRGEKDGHGSK